MIAIIFFILIPLFLYVILFIIETVFSFWRIKEEHRRIEYVHISWEFTHTLLVFAITSFIWLCSSVMPYLSNGVYTGAMILAAAFIVRAILYGIIFYILHDVEPNAGRLLIVRRLCDWKFAIIHIVILGTILYLAIDSIGTVLTTAYVLNDEFIPYMWPGFVLMLLVLCVPLFQLYKAYKNSSKHK